MMLPWRFFSQIIFLKLGMRIIRKCAPYVAINGTYYGKYITFDDAISTNIMMGPREVCTFGYAILT